MTRRSLGILLASVLIALVTISPGRAHVVTPDLTTFAKVTAVKKVGPTYERPLDSRRPELQFGQGAAQPPATEPPADDPWGFEEEEVDETWVDILRPQALDLALLIGFFALTLVSFFRKSVRLKYVTLVVAVVYMGFYKSYLISVVNIFGVMDWNLPIVKYNLTWYLLAIFTVASTVLWGRLYCGRICAFGALTQLMDATIPKKFRYDLPKSVERRAAPVKYVLLAGTVLYFGVTKDISVYRYVEPFWMFGLFQSTGLWIALGVLLVATVFVRNLYCRFLCPVGATLGLISNLTVFRIKRWSECNTCKICEKTCEWGAIRGPKIIASECVRCDDCERLYLDQQKCPHWLILKKKGGKAIMTQVPMGVAVPAPR